MFTLTSLLSVTASNKDLARPVSVAAEALSASPNMCARLPRLPAPAHDCSLPCGLRA